MKKLNGLGDYALIIFNNSINKSQIWKFYKDYISCYNYFWKMGVENTGSPAFSKHMTNLVILY